jgi:hypothetical protein
VEEILLQGAVLPHFSDEHSIDIPMPQPRLEITHATGRHAGGHLVDISPEHHRRLMDFPDRQSVVAHNSH